MVSTPPSLTDEVVQGKSLRQETPAGLSELTTTQTHGADRHKAQAGGISYADILCFCTRSNGQPNPLLLVQAEGADSLPTQLRPPAYELRPSFYLGGVDAEPSPIHNSTAAGSRPQARAESGQSRNRLELRLVGLAPCSNAALSTAQN